MSKLESAARPASDPDALFAASLAEEGRALPEGGGFAPASADGASALSAAPRPSQTPNAQPASADGAADPDAPFDASLAGEEGRALPEGGGFAPASADGAADPDDAVTLRYYGQDVPVPRAELPVLAQKGMDYDKVRAERDTLRAAMEAVRSFAREADALPGLAAAAGPAAPQTAGLAATRAEYAALLREHPGLTELPTPVLARMQSGEGPLSAYRAFENEQLRARLAAGGAAAARQTAPASAAGQGPSAPAADFLERLLADL